MRDALPIIQKFVGAAAKGEYLDGWAGRGVNPYGDDRPETSFVDNGKVESDQIGTRQN